MPHRTSLAALLSLLITLPALAGEPTSPVEAHTPPARAWQIGQLALEKEEYDRAIAQFQLALRLDGQFAPAHLSLAACYLAIGEEEKALPHLQRYLEARPAHLSVRTQYAELLHRFGSPEEARLQFERCVTDAQDQPEQVCQHLIHSHTRLMEIAERQGDLFAAHLNRGIGLFYLARQQAGLSEELAVEVAEGLFCKAAAELTLARLEQPESARACWYLHEVWASLAQRQPAQHWLRMAETLLTPVELTPAERRQLELACGKREDEVRARK
jgi:Tfp pilus assembly protein PilF